VLFAALILVPAVGYWRFNWNAIFAFWFAYVVTRPLGASFADFLGKPTNAGGLGWGSGWVALVLTAIIVGFVAFLAVTRRDVQGQGAGPSTARGAAHSRRGGRAAG
jgi:uncharacterized membrane-anchored protein